MDKLLRNFQQSDDEALLHLDVSMPTPEEHKQIIKELDAIEGLKFETISLYFIAAVISGEYKDVMDKMKQLEASGWAWKE